MIFLPLPLLRERKSSNSDDVSYEYGKISATLMALDKEIHSDEEILRANAPVVVIDAATLGPEAKLFFGITRRERTERVPENHHHPTKDIDEPPLIPHIAEARSKNIHMRSFSGVCTSCSWILLLLSTFSVMIFLVKRRCFMIYSLEYANS
ncbi:hypothetical protein K7X08_028887 [Anisodus acutangulus]|uniref:Uncharacterized protein n=1 Tax=Anisodus acutangulus TaxID=402998 RepID=A0A9Q1L2Z7_9SOLA|nr:hypothetical protein K7X08_028887 [Anisodus acutangulus]